MQIDGTLGRAQPSLNSKKSLALDPVNSRAQANLGVAYSRIDKHKEALLLYEKALRMLNEGEKPSQQLLFPQTIRLSKDEMVILSELIPHLLKLGFDIRIFGDDTAVIEAVPLNIKIGREQDCLQKSLNEVLPDICVKQVKYTKCFASML